MGNRSSRAAKESPPAAVVDEPADTTTVEKPASAHESAPDCPICWFPCKETCRTTCNHHYCSSCFKLMLQAGDVPCRGSCPMCRRPVSLFSTILLSSLCPLQQPQHRDIAGATYVQFGGLGIASYHFPTSDPHTAYISYESAPTEWVLDDGTRPPPRKPFENASYDADTRTFRGTISWHAPATFYGDARWEYEMTFSDNFAFIAGGEVTAIDSSGKRKPFDPSGDSPCGTRRYPDTLSYWRYSPPPSDLGGCVFIQAGKVGLASYHFAADDPSNAYISYAAADPEWILDDGERPPERKPFEKAMYDPEKRTFRGTVRWPAPATFQGDARWEYEMVFSEKFDIIADGEVCTFGPNGDVRDVQRYGSALTYARRVDEREELVATLRSRWNNNL